MTLQDIENWVLRFLQTDYTNGNWSQDEVQQYIDDEQMRLFVHIVGKDEDFFQSPPGFVSEIANQQRYSLPENLYKVLRVERVVGALASATSPIVMNPVDRNADSITLARGTYWPFIGGGTMPFPMNYQIIGQSQIDLYPIPNNTLTNSIKIHYAAKPARMVNPTDVPFQIANGPGGPGLDSLSEWHDIIAMGAAQRCLEHEEAYPQADRMGGRYAQRLAELVAYLQQINVQAPRYVRVTEDTWYS